MVVGLGLLSANPGGAIIKQDKIPMIMEQIELLMNFPVCPFLNPAIIKSPFFAFSVPGRHYMQRCSVCQ
jgi:hypothetical protein